MDIVKRNLIQAICIGAFHESSIFEPMSAYKWHHLSEMMTLHGIKPYLDLAINKYRFDNSYNIPSDLVMTNKCLPSECMTRVHYNDVHFASRFLEKRLSIIISNELHAIDTSVDTLQFLALVIHNMNSMLDNGLLLKGVITMGNYLRTDGDRIDFVKLETWLAQLKIKRMAQLQGSILILLLGFDKDEISFVDWEEKATPNLINRYILDKKAKEGDEKAFRQLSSGLIRNNYSLLYKEIYRYLSYFIFCPIEVFHHSIKHIIQSFSEIEE